MRNKLQKKEKIDADIAIIFDLGRVLVDIDFTKGLLKYYQHDQKEKETDIINRLFNDDIFVNFTSGKISAHQMYNSLVRKYQLKIGFDKFTQEWCNIFFPMDGMETLVRQIAARYTIGLLSDTDPLHWNYCLNTFHFLHLFNKPTLSYEVGALKPEAICYLTAAKNIGRSPKSCLFIDDREINVTGALNVGMRALLFKGVENLRNELKELRIL